LNTVVIYKIKELFIKKKVITSLIFIFIILFLRKPYPTKYYSLPSLPQMHSRNNLRFLVILQMNLFIVHA